jgi:hypothetical protein
MNAAALVLFVAAIVFGAFGVVFVIESIKQRDKKRAVTYSVGSFFAAVALGVGAMYMASSASRRGFSVYAPHENINEATMTAMISGMGTVA